MSVGCSAADVAPVSPDLRYSALGSASLRLKPVHKEENYVDALLSSSLLIARKGLPVEVQCLGLRMLQHLAYFRRKELMSTQFADLRKVLVGSLDDLVLKDATTVSDDPMGRTANPKENNRHKRCLLVVLAVNIDLRSLSAIETNSGVGNVRGGEGNLSLSSKITSHSGWSCDRIGGIPNETSCHSIFEDYDYAPFLNYPDSIGDIVSIIKSCKEFVEVAEPAMLVNVEMMSSHQEKGSLLLMEHNIISQAFLTLISYSGIHRYEEIHCLLSLLKNIWTSPEWRSKYLHGGSGLSCLFSDGLFLKMVHYMIRFCEVVLRRGSPEAFTASQSCEPYVVPFVWLFLPLILEVLQCVHGLWYPSISCNLSPVLERAKHLGPSFKFEHTATASSINDNEGFQEKGTRELIEGIRESGYNVIGRCASMEGAFSWLLNFSVSAALSKHLASLEFRHLRKLIKLTVIPLVKNCPCKFWKELVDNFLRRLLRHCENILHLAWSKLLYHGCPGASYYFGKLSGSEGEINTLKRDILLEFTREVSGLLEIIANRALSLVDGTQDKTTVSSQDKDFMPSTSLLKYLVINDCFGNLRMSLFGYFVDDASTVKAIPFCRALVCLATDTNDARLRIFILDNLLPCLIQCLDNKLQGAIQSLKCKLSSSTSDNTSKDLVVLCQELYGFMFNSGYVQTQVISAGDKNSNNFENSFEVWLERQKEDFRAKACLTAARNLSFGYTWKWEFEDECQRYLSAYIDMLLEVDSNSEFAEDIYVDEACLFQKLRPEFKAKYAINSCAHPYMHTISSIQHRKFYSMAAVVRKRKIFNLVRQLINRKPYIKGSDHPCDVIYRLKQTSEIPAALSKYMAPSVELLYSVLNIWEPRFHPMIREAQMNKLSAIVDGLRTECEEPLVPIVADFPLHLQPYAQSIIETKLNEPEYIFAKQQTRLHAQFDEHLATGELDVDIFGSMPSKVSFVEFISKKMPSRFMTLEHSLMKLSFERRTQIVYLQNDIRTYTECLLGLLLNEPIQAQCLISKLEAEGFFNVDSNRVDWGKASFSELVDKFSSDLLPFNSLPKHFAVRGLIDCRAILLMTDISLVDAFKKVVVDVHNSLTGNLQKFWKDTRYYQHEYYDIIRDPLRQVNWCSRTQPF